MSFEWYLALRYFKGIRKGSSFLSFIKIMSIAGVAIGSAGLLIALSIVHGFKSTINEKILGFAPHFTVVTYANPYIERADTLVTYFEGFPEIEKVQPALEGQVMIQTSDEVSGTILKGVDLDGGVSKLVDYVNIGTLDLTVQSNGMPGIVLGSKLVRQLRASVGDVITVYTVDGASSLIASPEIQQFQLTGIYQTGIDQFDDVYALVERTNVRKLLKLNDQQAQGIEIQLKDVKAINDFELVLNEKVKFPYFLDSIYTKFGNIFAWIELQENMIPLVISVMIIVAAFNLIGTVLMMVLERTRDIGILKTIGSRSSIVQRIFLLEGILVSVVGLIIGIGISLLFAYLQLEYQIIPLSEENYYMSYAPVELQFFDFVIVSVVTIALCAIASWIPARIAAKTDPLKVIAYGR
ncbi:MAG: ABC transporter permease [Balneolaceae bacterium]